MEKKENKVVVNSSQGYGYSYASLGDIAKQGFTLPKMKTGTEGEKEYIFYYDAELKEWMRGAEIVVPESKGMNKAQLYGSALTYARRYTALLSLQLACDDDKELESKPKSGIFDEPIPTKNLKSLADDFKKVVPAEAQEYIFKQLNVKRAEDLGIVNLQRYIEHYGKEQIN